MSIHKPVLLNETIDSLNLKPGMTVVDATLGGGGHSLSILEKIGENGTLIAIDMDDRALEKFKAQSLKFKNRGKIILVNDNFSNLDDILEAVEVEKVDAILADLGYSSDQLEDESIGMSFLKEGALDMRLSRKGELTAEKVVNEYEKKKLAEIIRDYGEERFSEKIARVIVEERAKKRITSTKELSDLVRQAIPERFQGGNVHPSARTFQAIRIEVNQEFESLERFLPKAISALKRGGRLAVITFHSLEDRIVKKIFRENARGCICPPNFPKCVCGHLSKIELIGKKPIVPSAKEIAQNPRSRSAKLRVCQKL